MEQNQSLFPSIIDKGQRLHIKIPSIRHSQLNFEVWFSILESWLGAKCKKKSHFLEEKKKGWGQRDLLMSVHTTLGYGSNTDQVLTPGSKEAVMDDVPVWRLSNDKWGSHAEHTQGSMVVLQHIIKQHWLLLWWTKLMETGEEISAVCDQALGRSGWQPNTNKSIFAGASAGRARTAIW